MMSTPTTLVKLVMVGDACVGKTSLMLRYSHSSFTTDFTTTIGIDFKVKTVELGGRKVKTVELGERKVKMQIWEIAGGEKIHTIAHCYYRGAKGFVIVYDVTDIISFQHVGKWIKDTEEYVKEGVERIIVGNKSDSEDRVVSLDQGAEAARKCGVRFVETSAKTGDNVEKCFMELAANIVDKLGVDEEGSSGQSEVTISEKVQRKLSSCFPC